MVFDKPYIYPSQEAAVRDYNGWVPFVKPWWLLHYVFSTIGYISSAGKQQIQDRAVFTADVDIHSQWGIPFHTDATKNVGTVYFVGGKVSQYRDTFTPGREVYLICVQADEKVDRNGAFVHVVGTPGTIIGSCNLVGCDDVRWSVGSVRVFAGHCMRSLISSFLDGFLTGQATVGDVYYEMTTPVVSPV